MVAEQKFRLTINCGRMPSNARADGTIFEEDGPGSISTESKSSGKRRPRHWEGEGRSQEK